jgi:hypothetical protein
MCNSIVLWPSLGSKLLQSHAFTWDCEGLRLCRSMFSALPLSWSASSSLSLIIIIMIIIAVFLPRIPWTCGRIPYTRDQLIWRPLSPYDKTIRTYIQPWLEVIRSHDFSVRAVQHSTPLRHIYFMTFHQKCQVTVIWFMEFVLSIKKQQLETKYEGRPKFK